MLDNLGKMDKSIFLDRLKILPLIMGGFFILITLFVWYNLEMSENNEIRLSIELVNEQYAKIIRQDLQHRIDALKRLANRWEVRNGTPKNEFYIDATHYVLDSPGYQAIEWADTSYMVKWIVPQEGNEKIKDLDILFESKRKKALELARIKKSASISEPVELVQGGKGFLVYLPLNTEDGFDGFIIAVIRIQDWLAHIFKENENIESYKKFHIVVSMDENLVYSQEDCDDSKNQEFKSEKIEKFADHNFHLTVHPTDQFLKENYTWLPEITLIFGVFLSLLSAIAIYIYYLAKVEYLKANDLTARLKTENMIRELTEKNLEKANKRMRLAAYSAGIGIWDYDFGEKYLYWDQMMFNIYEINENDFSGNTEDIFRWIHPDDMSKVEDLFYKSVKSEKEFELEFRIIRPSGEIRYIQAVAILIHDNEHKPSHITGINHDITARKIAEEELRSSELRWEFAVDGSELGLWDWNTQTNEVFFSPQWKKMLGFAEDEISGSLEEWDKRVHPDDKTKVYEDIEKHMRGETEVYLNEHRVLCKDETYKWILDRGKIIEWDEGNKPLRMIGTHTDITDQKIAEEKIKSSNQRMMLAADSAGIGIWEFDVENEKLHWDEWMLRLYGLKNEDFQGGYEAWENGIHPDDREKTVEAFSGALTGQTEFDVEFRVVHHNGGVRTLKANALVINDENGKPLKMIGISYDITERKRTEENKAQEARLKTAVQLAQAVAHEFRQPMTTLNLVSELISMEDVSLEFVRKNLKKIPDSIDRINKLVDYLLKIEDVKTFKYTTDLDVFDIMASAGEKNEEDNS